MNVYTSDALRRGMDRNYTPVPNALLIDSGLSASAKLVWVSMFSKPHGWDFSAKRIGDELGMSHVTVKKLLNELIDGSWLIRFTESRRSKYVFLVPNKCVSRYDEMDHGVVGHTYGYTGAGGDDDGGNGTDAPSLSFSNALERVKDSYAAYDLDAVELEMMAEQVRCSGNWDEFDALCAEAICRVMDSCGDVAPEWA